MPRKLTIKQENFVMTYVETGNACEAYRQAYNGKNMKSKTVEKRSSDLLKNGVVKGGIERLREQHRERHNITIDSLTDELEETRKRAITDGDAFPSEIAATMGKAKLHGLITNNKNTGTQVNVAIIVPEKEEPGEWEKNCRPE